MLQYPWVDAGLYGLGGAGDARAGVPQDWASRQRNQPWIFLGPVFFSSTKCLFVMQWVPLACEYKQPLEPASSVCARLSMDRLSCVRGSRNCAAGAKNTCFRPGAKTSWTQSRRSTHKKARQGRDRAGCAVCVQTRARSLATAPFDLSAVHTT